MTAKEYLSQVRRLDQRIGALLDRQKKYHELGAWRPIRFDGEKGPRAMVALERELDARIAEYAEKVADGSYPSQGGSSWDQVNMAVGTYDPFAAFEKSKPDEF